MAYLGTKPANQVIDSTLIADGTITTSDLADNSITTAKIAAGAVIPADLSTGAPVWDTSGNVGIGTSSPTKQLSIGSSATATLGFTWNGDGLTKAGIETNHNTGEVRYAAFTNYFPTFYSNNTERMRIDSSGNLMVGTTTTLARLTVTDVGSGTVSVMQSGTTAGVAQVAFANPNGYVGSITTSGSSTAYNTSSDYRLKENIALMTGALGVVQQLKPVTYNWKVDGSSGQGFIAHELQAVVPDCVTGEKDAVDAEGNPQYQGIDTSFLVATLTAAIQEQQAIITDLRTELDSLKSEVTALKGQA